MKPKEIRASFDATTITVYQAFSPAIAEAAVAHQTSSHRSLLPE
jgi:hypothetical protein